MKKFSKILSIVIFFLLLFYLGSFFIREAEEFNQDLGRHIKSGQVMIEQRTILKTNFFSYTLPEHSIINHHWLSQVVFYLLFKKTGLVGLMIFGTLLAIFSFALVYPKSKRLTAQILAPLIGFLAIRVIIERNHIRPELFSLFFFAFFIFLLLRFQKSEGKSKLIWSLPLLQILWTNSHIYFFLGPTLILCAFISLLVQKKFQLAKILLIIGVLAVFATLVNPWFFRGAIYFPFAVKEAKAYSIAELKPFWFIEKFYHLDTLPYFEALLVFLWLAIFSLFFSGRKNLNFFLLFIALLGTAMAFIAIRNFAFFAIVALTVIGEVIGRENIQTSLSNLVGRTGQKITFLLSKRIQAGILIFWNIIFLGFLSWQIGELLSGEYWKRQDTDSHFKIALPRTSQNAVDFVRENKIPGNIFNNFNIGGFLIWKLWPEKNVFVDNRPEAYGKEFIQGTFIPMLADEKAWKERVEKYKIKIVIVDYSDALPEFSTFLNRLINDSDFKLVFLDQRALVFVKREVETEELISRNLVTEGAMEERMEEFFQKSSHLELLRLANLFEGFGWQEAASNYYKELTKAYPHFAPAFVSYGYFLNRSKNQKDKEEAIKILTIATRLSSYTISHITYSGLYTVLGRLHYEKGNFHSAEYSFRQAIKHYKDNDIAAIYLNEIAKRKSLWQLSPGVF